MRIHRCDCLNSRFARRSFLAALPASVFAAARAVGATADDNPLHVLTANDIERLRLDFNASRSKVRLLLLLSPT